MHRKLLLAFGALAIAGGCASHLHQSAPATFGQSGDEERGCCVTPGAQNKCVYSNAAFCRSQAEKAGLAYEFHPNVSCSALPQCQ
jgi:hypothetical protein